MLFEFMHVKPRSPYLNLALDEAVAFFFGEWSQRIGIYGGIRLWCNKPSIILGRTDNPLENLATGIWPYVSVGKKKLMEHYPECEKVPALPPPPCHHNASPEPKAYVFSFGPKIIRWRDCATQCQFIELFYFSGHEVPP